jgi:uncharacterized protein (DUF2267 family)/uncharacterized C2H2 Zn-finger protein
MSKLAVLGRSTQATHIWVKEAAEELKWLDERRAFLALCTVLHALRDRLTVQEAVQFAAQLPTFVRGCFYDGWKSSRNPVRDATRYGFLGEIQTAFGRTHEPQVDAVHVVRSIFRLLNRKISEGEIRDVKSTLPESVRDLWPESPVRKKTAPRAAKAGKPQPATHTVEELIAAAEQEGRAVLGLAATLRAINTSSAWLIMYAAGTPFSGTECPACGGLFAVGKEECRYCESPVRYVANLGKRIRERVEERGIKFETISGPGLNVLCDAGGIGAFLKT